MDPETLQEIAAADARLVAAAKDVKVLSHLAWPARLAEEFLARWQAGDPRLPEVPRPRYQFDRNIAELRAVMDECDLEEPIGRYLLRTARSYVTAARMVERIGTPEFTQRSIELYGAPGDRIGPNAVTNLEAAELFLSLTDDFRRWSATQPDDVCLRPEYVAEQLRERIAQVFAHHPITVEIDLEMASKAAAGARGCASAGRRASRQQDIAQLAEHEVFVHSLTSINGREQPLLRSMGLGAPRTTATQEGLATFAELITNAMDLPRLRRLALRVKAIQMGLDGADFIEVFKFFVESRAVAHGELPLGGAGVSRRRRARTHGVHQGRGVPAGADQRAHLLPEGDPPGPAGVHPRPVRGAHGARRRARPRRVLPGRSDRPPRYEPAWIKNQPTLAAFLIYSIFNTRLEIGDMHLSDFSEPPPEASS
jgi:uncharacterized protein (TIGR02421 family)